jgi:hypothetical protein
MSLPTRRSFLGSLAAMGAVGIRHGSRAAEAPAIASAGSTRNPPIPKVAAPLVNIYKPQADVFTLPTVRSAEKDGGIVYAQGKTYQDWRTNDHTFIKDRANRWHCFGITKPWISGDNGHAGEGMCFHAVAPEGTLGQAIRAPEIIQDESGQWFMSSTDRPHRGISVAPLVWD